MSNRMPIAVMIPTKNEEKNLPYALESVKFADQVFVLDSGSTDSTRQIAESMGATFVHHDWEGYAAQKNWGLDNLPITQPWVFILDADEVITPELRDELIKVAREDKREENGFYVNRFFIFLDKRIRHCGYYPSWNLRFFRRGKARYEVREVHEHMIVDGKVGYLKHDMEHNDRRGMEYYIAKHNHYSTLEARELFRIEQAQTQGTMRYSPFGGPLERRRWVKHVIWPKLPAKWFFRWLYMYVLKLGILDGITGFHFCLFLASYEHQITLKLAELRREARQSKAGAGAT
jgi:glycosyltransferase involved in cell wall biosynthesis